MTDSMSAPTVPDLQPLVSVIMIFLDAEAFIAEAIESVLAQRYANFELLLVDDGSTDASTAIARRYAKDYPGRIRYLDHDGHVNRGMSASRNAGIAAASGTLISLLDADDVWRPETLNQQVQTIVAHPEVGMAYGATEIWHSWSGNPDDARRDYVRPLGVPTETVYEPPRLLSRFIAGEARPPATCSLIVRRTALEAVGGFEERFRGLHEDQVIFAKLCCTVPIYVSGTAWGRYRQHADSWCAAAAHSASIGREQELFLSWLGAYVSARGFADPELRRLLRTKLWRYRHRSLSRFLDRAARRRRQAMRLLYLFLGNGPWIAFDPSLVPSRRLRRRGGMGVDEAWFRRGHAWVPLLRRVGGLTPNSHVLELDPGLGQIAYALRYVLSADGSYTGVGGLRESTELLARQYRYSYPNFSFHPDCEAEYPDRSNGVLQVDVQRFPFADAAFDLVLSATALRHRPPGAVAKLLHDTARKLKPGGRCAFEVMLLDHFRPGQPRRGMFADRAFEFDARSAAEFVAVPQDDGHAVVAYRLRLLETLAADAGLTVDSSPVVGTWSGALADWTEELDLIVLKNELPQRSHVPSTGASDTAPVEDVS
jgi:glycosyltransferase involved in cell wall biosynthesis